MNHRLFICSHSQLASCVAQSRTRRARCGEGAAHKPLPRQLCSHPFICTRSCNFNFNFNINSTLLSASAAAQCGEGPARELVACLATPAYALAGTYHRSHTFISYFPPQLTTTSPSASEMLRAHLQCGEGAARELGAYFSDPGVCLSRLVMAAADLDDGETSRFVERLRHNTSLTYLDLSRNLIGKQVRIPHASSTVVYYTKVYLEAHTSKYM
jgi:hypothetical protein